MVKLSIIRYSPAFLNFHSNYKYITHVSFHVQLKYWINTIDITFGVHHHARFSGIYILKNVQVRPSLLNTHFFSSNRWPLSDQNYDKTSDLGKLLRTPCKWMDENNIGVCKSATWKNSCGWTHENCIIWKDSLSFQ